MARTFTLGGPILKTSESTAHAPDTWREALLRALDSAGRANLGLTCKPALQWLLEDCEHATLTVPISSARRTADVLRRMHAAKQQLAQRHGRPTTLRLQQDGAIPRDEEWWPVALAALSAGYTPQNFTLALSFKHITADLVSFAGSCFPGLTSLQLHSLDPDNSGIQLPRPAVVPCLKRLTLSGYGSVITTWAAVRPYLTQLVSLSIEQYPIWAVLFHTSTVSHTLTHLRISQPLRPHITELLQEHTPALQHVSATALLPEYPTTEVPNPVCSWRVVELSDCFHFESLSWLPLPAEDKLVVRLVGAEAVGEASMPLCSTVASKLASIEIEGLRKLHLRADSTQPDAQPSALRAALPALTAALPHEPTIELVVTDCTLSAALAAELRTVAAAAWVCKLSLENLSWPVDADAAAAHPPQQTQPAAAAALPAPQPAQPAQPQLLQLPQLDTLHVPIQLDQSLLARLKQNVTSVNVLGVTGLSLQEAPAPGWRLPCRAVKVHGGVQLASWLARAQLLGSDVSWELKNLYLTLTPEQVDTGIVMVMAQQLRQARLTRVHKLHVTVDADAAVSDHASLLRASLTLARAMPCVADVIVIGRFVTTTAVVAELRFLPHWWAIDLCLSGCECLLSAPEAQWPLARAPWLIPRSYTRWFFDTGDSLHPEEFEAILANTPGDRTAQEPLVIEFCAEDPGSAYTKASRMQLSGLFPHVTVGMRYFHSEDDV